MAKKTGTFTRLLLALAHLSGPLGFGCLWLPGLIWYARRDDDNFTKRCARQAALGQGAYFALIILAVPIALENTVEDPWLEGGVFLAIFSAWFVVALLAARAAWREQPFVYPLLGALTSFDPDK